jgi:uncharacterized membrane protein
VTEPSDETRDQPDSEADEDSVTAELEKFETLPDQAKNDLAQRIALRMVRMERRYHRGPLPDPKTLQGYEDVVPGSAKQIINQANAQTDHRMRLERMAIEANLGNSKRGQWFGFIIAMAVVGVGALAVFTGAGLIGLGLILPGLAALVGVFVYSQRQQQGQLQERRDAFPAAAEPPSALRSAIEQEGEEGADRQE